MGIHHTAIIEEGAEISAGVTIREFVIIRAGAKIGRNCVIAEFCLIEAAEIGDGTNISNHSTLRAKARIGKGCVIAESCLIEAATIGDNTTIRKSATIRAGANIGAGCVIAEYALIEAATIGNGTKIWDHAKARNGAEIGNDCNIGAKTNIDTKVKIGSNCKIQNSVNMFEGLTLEDGIFVGPNVQFTNFLKPRAINIDGSKRMGGEISPTLVKTGARICTNATIVCGITLGEWCFIAPHACIRSNVGEYEFWAGVPAKQKGHMCHCGERTINIEDKEERIIDGYSCRKWLMPYCENCKQFLPEDCNFWQK